MKRKLLVAIALHVSCIYPAVTAVPKSKSLAFLSPGTVLRQGIDFLPLDGHKVVWRALPSSKRWYLEKLALKFIRCLETGQGTLLDLDNMQSAKSLGLIKDDFDELKEYLRDSYCTKPVLEIAYPSLPKWIANTFEHKMGRDFIDFHNEKYDFLGPVAIRTGVAEFAFQEWNQIRHGHKKYWHVQRGRQLARNSLITIANDIDIALADATHAFKYIGNIQNNQVDSGVEYIIVMANDLINKTSAVLDTLNAILDPNTGNPRLNIVVAFDDDATTILDGFNSSVIPPSIRNLIVIGSSITAIESFFLDDCSGLKVLDLTGLSNVTHIGDFFLDNCSGLKAVNLTGLSNVKHIGNSFLGGCLRLTALDLTALSNVTHIGDFFLDNCSGLKALGLRALSNVTQIESFFLSGCLRLTALDLTALSNVTRIGDNFLYCCLGLTALDLTGLSNVTQIGNWFLAYCSGLKVLDLTALSKLTQIEKSFLFGCLRLTALDLTALSNVTQIGSRFLADCSELTKMTITRKLYDKLDKEKLFDFSRLRQNKTITIIEAQSAAAAAVAKT